EGFGKQRCFDEEFVGRCGAKNQEPAVEGAPFQPQPPLFNEINGSDFIVLPKQDFVSGERPSFKRVLVERKHRYIPTSVNVMPSQTGRTVRQALPVTTGSPAARHSGRPSCKRRTLKPRARSAATAS